MQALDDLEHHKLVATPQPTVGITYAHKIQKAEGVLDLRLPAKELDRRIRAFNPFPGATLELPGIEEPVKVWDCCVVPNSGDQPPGTVLAATREGIDVATGQGAIRLLELQRPGAKRQPVGAFVASYRPTP